MWDPRASVEGRKQAILALLRASHGVRNAPAPRQDIPELLAWWYRVRPPGSDRAVNRVLEPSELTEHQGRWTFYVAHDHLWCTSSEGADPPVWGARRPESRGEEPGWQLEGERLSGFLFQLLLFETICSAPVGARGLLRAEDLDRVRAALPTLPLARWRWPVSGSELRGTPRCAAFIAGSEVVVGARELEDLAWLRPIPQERWRGASFLGDDPG